jgi:adenosylcobyric acid synthase
VNARPAATLMLQGTASSVGKSLLVTALCRILRQDGYRVAPFKAQNMSNNSFVTADGLELGRAQAVQAEAAGIEPLAAMNPILLKPEADHRSQVVVLGRPQGHIGGGDFIERKAALWQVVTESLDRLRRSHDVVVIEGAGSPAEINLRAGDIVNMRVALQAQSPVLLVGDIDRGGVFAHLVGTLQLLEDREHALVKGLVINKFRGTASLLEPGLDWLTRYTGIPVAGVIPWLHNTGVAEEDAVVLEQPAAAATEARYEISVPRLPHIANFDDFDALAAEPDVRLRFVTRAAELAAADLVVLPGTKSTMADLEWLRNAGLARAVTAHAAAGRPVIGICGGFQMLGDRLLDPEQIESSQPSATGLGLLPATTTFERVKATHRARATVVAARGLLSALDGTDLTGYEIHMGSTITDTPAFCVRSRSGVDCRQDDGAIDASGLIVGTYLHGLFDNDAFRAAVLQALASMRGRVRPTAETRWSREQAYDRVAKHVRDALDITLVYRLLEQQ